MSKVKASAEEKEIMVGNYEDGYQEGYDEGVTEQADLAQDVIDKWKDEIVTDKRNMEIVIELYQVLELIAGAGIDTVPTTTWESEDA